MAMSKKNYDKGSSNIVIAIIVVLTFIGIAIYATQGGNSKSSASALADSNGELAPQVAPDFSLEKLGGGTISLAEYKGRKGVVLDFFATWCPNCRRDMPKLNGFYEKYKDQVEVIGVNLHEDESVVERFIEKTGITFPIALDPSGIVARSYRVRYTNFHVLIDKEGNAIKAIPGDISESDILLLIN
jgi:peroxiredoxin